MCNLASNPFGGGLPALPPVQGSAVAAQASAMSSFSHSGGEFDLPPTQPPVQGYAVAAQASSNPFGDGLPALPPVQGYAVASAMSSSSHSGGEFDLPPTQPPVQGMFGGSAVAAQASAMSSFSPSGGDDPDGRDALLSALVKTAPYTHFRDSPSQLPQDTTSPSGIVGESLVSYSVEAHMDVYRQMNNDNHKAVWEQSCTRELSSLQREEDSKMSSKM